MDVRGQAYIQAAERETMHISAPQKGGGGYASIYSTVLAYDNPTSNLYLNQIYPVSLFFAQVFTTKVLVVIFDVLWFGSPYAIAMW